MPKHTLRRTSHVFYVIEGDGEFRAYEGVVLGHDGDFTVTKMKVTAGENFANGLITTGVNYFGNIPHGDVGQGGTWVWGDEIPAGFYVG